MDTEASLLPTALFSPSKARQQRAQAQEWAHVDAWLASKHAGRDVPSFERNGDTLKALLALAAANERADDEAALVEAAEGEALRELRQGQLGTGSRQTHERSQATEYASGQADGSPCERADAAPPSSHAILESLSAALTPQATQSLHALSALSVTLSTATPAPAAIAARLVDLTATSHALTQHLARLDRLHAHLSSELSDLRAQLAELHDNPSFAAPPDLAERTVAWVRNTKQLRAKLAEYSDRLAALGSASPTKGPRPAVAVARVVELETEVMALRQEVEEDEGKVERFWKLPPDIEEARRMVRERIRALEELKARRSALFEGLVGT